jgi:hypothetical protein
VNECENLHLGRCHLVEQAIATYEELPDVGLVDFWNWTAALAMHVKRGSASSAWIRRRSAA